MTVSGIELELSERRRALDRQRSERDSARGHVLSVLGLFVASMTFLGGTAARQIPAAERDTVFFLLLLAGILGVLTALILAASAISRARVEPKSGGLTQWLWQWEIYVDHPTSEPVTDEQFRNLILPQYSVSIEANADGLAKLGWHLLAIIAVAVSSISLWVTLLTAKAV